MMVPCAANDSNIKINPTPGDAPSRIILSIALLIGLFKFIQNHQRMCR